MEERRAKHIVLEIFSIMLDLDLHANFLIRHANHGIGKCCQTA